MEENILIMNRRLEELFLLSGTRHEAVVGLVRGLDNRVSNLGNRFDKKLNHDNDDDDDGDTMSAKF